MLVIPCQFQMIVPPHHALDRNQKLKFMSSLSDSPGCCIIRRRAAEAAAPNFLMSSCAREHYLGRDELSVDQLEKCRLSSTVGPNQGEPGVEVHAKLEVLVDVRCRVAVPETHVLEGKSEKIEKETSIGIFFSPVAKRMDGSNNRSLIQ